MNRWLKWIGYAVGGLLAMLVPTAAGVYGISEARYLYLRTLPAAPTPGVQTASR